jgi:hypothetical protein
LAQATIRQVRVLDSKEVVEIEIEASDRIVPQTQALTGPDRLVMDFPNAIPGSQLRSLSVLRGEVKDVHVGLFQTKPPVTRIVLDLKSAQPYQVFPYGRTVIVKVAGGGGKADAGSKDPPRPMPAQPALVASNYAAGTEHVQADAAKPVLEVSFRNGLLTVNAIQATLTEILLAVQQSTGAQVSLAAGAEQEKVVANLGPAPAPEVLARLLNGSKFNFLILSAANDPRQLKRVILSPRVEGGPMPLPPQPGSNAGNAPPIPPARVQGQPAAAQPPSNDPRLPRQLPPDINDDTSEQ